MKVNPDRRGWQGIAARRRPNDLEPDEDAIREQEARMEAELGTERGAWSHPESHGSITSRAFHDNETERDRNGGT